MIRLLSLESCTNIMDFIRTYFISLSKDLARNQQFQLRNKGRDHEGKIERNNLLLTIFCLFFLRDKYHLFKSKKKTTKLFTIKKINLGSSESSI